MKKYDKILFVSHSDTCRGPMAEAIMQHKVLLEDVLIDSKAMIALIPEPVNPKALEILASHDLMLEGHESAQFSADDFDSRTLILTMEEGEKKKIQDEYPDRVKNLYTLSEYSGSGAGDIYDPYGQDLEDYGHCFDMLEEMLSKLVEVIKKEEENYDSSSM